jgi:DNA ligase-1
MKPYKMTMEELNHVIFPTYATPKIDGIRCTKINGKALTASHKPIPNIYIRTLIERSSLPDGFDGELKCPGAFDATVSAVMSEMGTPPFTWLVFDYISDIGYVQRMENLRLWFLSNRCAFAQPVMPDLIRHRDDLVGFNDAVLAEGYEGSCFRKPGGLYKNGRSTFNEQLLLAIKPFVDAEAVVIGMAEMLHNGNPAEENELGLTHRTTHAENKTGLGVMGALVVTSDKGTFRIGSGFTQAQRLDFWTNPEKVIGAIVTYKYQLYGTKDKPRIPVFKAIRGTNANT